MVVRLSDIRAKTGQKCIFCDFRLFLSSCQTVLRPYRLSYIDALCINQSYQPKDGSVKFSRKNFKNWQFWKTAILKNRPFWIFFLQKKFFFCIFLKISPNLYGRMDGSKLWCLPWFPENSLLCAILRYTVYVPGSKDPHPLTKHLSFPSCPEFGKWAGSTSLPKCKGCSNFKITKSLSKVTGLNFFLVFKMRLETFLV